MERMERVEKPSEDDAHIFTGEINPLVPGGKWVFDSEHLKIGYDHPLLEITMRIRRGQKIALLGPNGAGKTTFLKTVAGYLPVSYTHLDVYKRQNSSRAGSCISSLGHTSK